MTPFQLACFFSVTFLTTAAVSYLACWQVGKVAARMGFVDRPGGHKSHGRPIPLGGGLGIVAAVLSFFAVGMAGLYLAETSPEFNERLPDFVRVHLGGVWSQVAKLWILLAGGTILALVGWWDDAKGLNWQLRLGLQIAVASACVTLIPNLRLTAFVGLPVWTTALSVFWIVGLVNAFNMLDNMDGLSSGVAILCGLFLSAILLFGPNPEAAGPQLFVAGLILVVSGATFGFWRHNYPPARLFMGDAGSYFIGFFFAVTTILASYTRYDSSQPHAVLAPLFVMAVPLYDMTSVILLRLLNGKSPFAADQKHFSHRLVELGLSRPRAVQAIYLVTCISGLAAFLLHRVDHVGAIILIALMGCQFAFVALLEISVRRTVRK